MTYKPQSENQSVLYKFGLLFLFGYIFLYCNSVQFLLSSYFEMIWTKTVPWFSKVAGASTEVAPKMTGSGDTLYDYYSNYFFAVLALIFAIVVTVVDYKRKNYRTLTNWMFLLLRYYVASQMISYGFAKLFYTQFGPPSLWELSGDLGDKTPMGLLWTFMGFSKTYCMFTGFAELVGGLLLLSRRTTLLGGLISFGVMVNVMMMNYCYDVPVKLLSTHLVVFSFVIISFWGRELLDFFALQRGYQPKVMPSVLSPKWQKIMVYVKWAVLIIYLGQQVNQSLKYVEMVKEYQKISSPLYGSYYVDDFVMYRDGELMPDPAPQIVWDELLFLENDRVVIKLEKSRPYSYQVVADSTDNSVMFKSQGSDSLSNVFHYEFFDENKLRLNGSFKEDSIRVNMHKRDPFRLMNSKFNWVQEYPNNR